MKAGAEIQIIPFEKFRFVNTTNEPLLVKYKLEAALPGEAISIVTKDAKIKGGRAKSEHIDFDALKNCRTFVGHAEGVD